MRLVLYLRKSVIHAHTRIDPRTGKMEQVPEYQDKRIAAQEPLRMGRPVARTKPTAPPHRYMTIHEQGPDRPRQTVRIAPHPEKPGVWQVQSPQQFYNPKAGDRQAARVGVPAMQVPPPPPIPRLPNLLPDERKAESDFASAYEADPDGMAHAMIDAMARGELGDAPNIFAPDEAKQLSSFYNCTECNAEGKLSSRALYNTATHQTATAIAKRAFLKYLDENVTKLAADDERRCVLMTAGGVAAGKDYALIAGGLLPGASKIQDISQRVGAVWNAAGEANSVELQWVHAICRDRNIPLAVVYVHADPEQTWENPKRGVVQRAKIKGRMVDARLFADSYAHGPHIFREFAESVADDSNTLCEYIDNSVGVVPKRVDALPAHALNWDADQLHEWCLQKLHESDVPESIKRGGSRGKHIWGQASGGSERSTSGAVRGPTRGVSGKPGGQQPSAH